MLLYTQRMQARKQEEDARRQFIFQTIDKSYALVDQLTSLTVKLAGQVPTPENEELDRLAWELLSVLEAKFDIKDNKEYPGGLEDWAVDTD